MSTCRRLLMLMPTHWHQCFPGFFTLCVLASSGTWPFPLFSYPQDGRLYWFFQCSHQVRTEVGWKLDKGRQWRKEQYKFQGLCHQYVEPWCNSYAFMISSLELLYPVLSMWILCEAVCSYCFYYVVFSRNRCIISLNQHVMSSNQCVMCS